MDLKVIKKNQNAQVSYRNTASNTTPTACSYCGSTDRTQNFSQSDNLRTYSFGQSRFQQSLDNCGNCFSMNQPLLCSPPLFQSLLRNIPVPANMFFPHADLKNRPGEMTSTHHMFRENLMQKMSENKKVTKQEDPNVDQRSSNISNQFSLNQCQCQCPNQNFIDLLFNLPCIHQCACQNSIPWTNSPFIVPMISYCIVRNSRPLHVAPKNTCFGNAENVLPEESESGLDKEMSDSNFEKKEPIEDASLNADDDGDEKASKVSQNDSSGRSEAISDKTDSDNHNQDDTQDESISVRDNKSCEEFLEGKEFDGLEFNDSHTEKDISSEIQDNAYDFLLPTTPEPFTDPKEPESESDGNHYDQDTSSYLHDVDTLSRENSQDRITNKKFIKSFTMANDTCGLDEEVETNVSDAAAGDPGMTWAITTTPTDLDSRKTERLDTQSSSSKTSKVSKSGIARLTNNSKTVKGKTEDLAVGGQGDKESKQNETPKLKRKHNCASTENSTAAMVVKNVKIQKKTVQELKLKEVNSIRKSSTQEKGKSNKVLSTSADKLKCIKSDLTK